MHDTSREAYETAVTRNKTAVENVRRAKAMLERAQDELIAADAALCAQEHSPGVPLWTRQDSVAAPQRWGYRGGHGYDPPGCAKCDATYTELDSDGHCADSGACGRRIQSDAYEREAAKAGAR